MAGGPPEVDPVAAARVDLEGWTRRQVNALSVDGALVLGRGSTPAGDAEPWTARLDGLRRPE